MRHDQIGNVDTYEAIDLADFQIGLAQPEAAPFRSAAAVPDMPAAIGKMLVAAYVLLLAAFAITIAHSRGTMFDIVICAVLLTLYVSVPRILLGVEPNQGHRPSFGAFLTKGMDTATGHCSGKDALVQVLIVPVLLTCCALAIGIVALTVL
jgi:hypothetical protein